MSFGSAMGWDMFFSAVSQERQMDRDADAADTSWRRGQENMRLSNEFTERMANTVNQRGVVDLRAAGLNPILAATRGMGAPGGTGAMANAPTQAPAPDFSKTFGPTVGATKTNLEQDSMLKVQQQYNVSRDTERKYSEQKLTDQELETEKHRTEAAKHEADILQSNAKGRALEGKIDETKFGEIMRYIDRAMDAIRGGSGAIRDHRAPPPRETIHRRGPPVPRK